MASNKYEFVENDELIINNIVLKRIRALIEIPANSFCDSVSPGELGGYIQSESNLSNDKNDTAWVYDTAIVYENAKVFSNARIFEDAHVFGSAKVFGNAIIYGGVKIYCSAQVFENACINTNAMVYGNAMIHGNAEVSENSKIFGNAEVYGKSEVCYLKLSGNSVFKDNLLICDGAIIDFNLL